MTEAPDTIEESPVRLVTEFRNQQDLENYLTWLREPDSTYHQPFGADVNAFRCGPEDDFSGGVFIMVPGHRVAERSAAGGVPILEVSAGAPVTTSSTAPPPPLRPAQSGGEDTVAPY